MFKHVLRAGAVALGTVLSVCALAAPAAAEDVVPEGCVGTVYYACTGDAQPPEGWFGAPIDHGSVPVRLTTASFTVVPGVTVGGQEIGGVVVTVGGELAPGQTVVLGGPIDPVATGIVSPVNLCLFVTCLVAGEPIVLPGRTLPVVPVVVPAVTTPVASVPVPMLATVPEETTPTVVVPATSTDVTTLHVYESGHDYHVTGSMLCAAGGGTEYWVPQEDHYACAGGVLAPAANYFYDRSR